MRLYDYFRTLATATLVIVFVAACGGGGGGGASAGSSSPLADESIDVQPVSQEILGADIDSDGIRDDVQMKIESEYAGDLEKIRKLKALAQIDRENLSSMHDATRVEELWSQELRAYDCFLREFNTRVEGVIAYDYYMDYLYDTPERQLKSFELDAVKNETSPNYLKPTDAECSQ